MNNINVIPTEGAEETFDILAKSIVQISEGFDKLNRTALKRDTMVILIHDATKVPKKQINTILNYLPLLKSIYLKPNS